MRSATGVDQRGLGGRNGWESGEIGLAWGRGVGVLRPGFWWSYLGDGRREARVESYKAGDMTDKGGGSRGQEGQGRGVGGRGGGLGGGTAEWGLQGRREER